MNKRHTIQLGIFFLGLLMVTVTASSGNPEQQEPVQTDSLEYYKERTRILEKKLIKWTDSAYRLKQIAGIPEDECITWKNKVLHPVDTKALAKADLRSIY